MADFGTVARPYARALFDLASANDELEKWSNALAAVAAVVNYPLAKKSLARPDLGDRQRIDLVQGLCQDLPGGKAWATPQGRNLLQILVENDRLAAVREIATQFDELKAAAENTVKATLVSAVAVDKAIADKVATALQKKLGRTGRAYARGGP